MTDGGKSSETSVLLTATQPTFEPRRLPAGWTHKTVSKLSKLLCAELQDYCFGINLYILCYRTSSTNTNINLRVARTIFVNFQSWKQKTHLRPEKFWKVHIATLDRVWRICRFSQPVQKKAACFQTEHKYTLSHAYFLTTCDNVPVSCHDVYFLLWKQRSEIAGINNMAH